MFRFELFIGLNVFCITHPGPTHMTFIFILESEKCKLHFI